MAGTPVGQSNWDKAYTSLCKDNPDVVVAYERALVKQSRKSRTPNAVPLANLSSLTGPERQSELLKVLTRQEEALREAQWRVKFFGKELAVREAVSNIAASVLWAKDFITQAAAAEPHAALAWAGVSVLLPLLTNPSQQDEAAIAGLDRIRDILIRYSIIERVYSSKSLDKADSTERSARDSLAAHIVDIYRSILEFQIRLATKYARKTALNVLRDIVKADDWKGILEQLKASDDAAGDMIQTINYVEGQTLHTQMQTQAEALRNEIRAMMESQLEQRHKIDQILETLLKRSAKDKDTPEKQCLDAFCSTLDYTAEKNRNDINVANTGTWFLHHEAFLDFLDSDDSRLLFVTAEPGMGKSTLMRSVIEGILRPSSTCVTSYFFFKDESKEQRSAAEALSAVIHQILLQRPSLIQEPVLQYVEDVKVELNKIRFHLNRLWQILLAIADKCEDEIYCVLDALDECGDSEREVLMKSVNAYFRDSQRSTKLKFLISGRPYFDSRFKFQRLTDSITRYQVRLAGEEQLVRDDVEQITTAKVYAMAGVDVETKERLISTLRISNDNTRSLLPLKMILDELDCNPDLDGADLLRIEELMHAQSIDDFYENMLARSQDPKRARKLLNAILVAQRPLTLAEFRVVDGLIRRSRATDYNQLGLQSKPQFQTSIRAVCQHLISFTGESVHLFHQTVKEYLMCSSDNGESLSSATWRHSVSSSKAHLTMLEVCLQNLEFDGFDSLLTKLSMISAYRKCQVRMDSTDVLAQDNTQRRSRFWMGSYRIYTDNAAADYPFLSYTAKFWRRHYRLSESTSDGELRNRPQAACDLSAVQFWVWLLLGFAQHVADPSTTATFPTYLLEALHDVNFRICQDLTAWIPTGYSDAKAVKMKSIATYAGQSKDPTTQLKWHVSKGLRHFDHTLTEWAHVRMRVFNLTRYSIRSRYDFGGQSIQPWPLMPLSISRAIQLFENGRFGTLQYVTSYHPFDTLMQSIVQEGTLAHLRAAFELREGQQWIQKSNFVFADAPEESWTAKARAQLIKDTTVPEDDVVHVSDHQGRTLLMIASRYAQHANCTLIESLLTAGSDVNTEDGSGHTALMHATDNFRTRIGRERRAVLRLEQEEALERQHEGLERVLALLLRYGANPVAATAERPTALPLLYAIKMKMGATLIKELILAGEDLEMYDSSGKTPLIFSISGNDTSASRILLQNGADPNTPDHLGVAPVHYALGCPMADAQGRKEYPWTYQGRIMIGERFPNIALPPDSMNYLELLDEFGADFNVSANSYGHFILQCGPIDLAALCNDADAVAHLLQAGAEVKISHETYDGEVHPQALIWATRHHNESVVSLLLEHGAETTSKDGTFATALMWAAILDDIPIATMLLEHGADPNVRRQELSIEVTFERYQTPLYYAVQQANEQMVDLLISKGADVNQRIDTYVAIDKRRRKKYFEPGTVQTRRRPNVQTTVLTWARDSMRDKLISLGAHGREVKHNHQPDVLFSTRNRPAT